MRSFSLPTLHNKDTGRELKGSELSPVFGIGIRLECFQNSGNLPSLNDLLNKIFKNRNFLSNRFKHFATDSIRTTGFIWIQDFNSAKSPLSSYRGIPLRPELPTNRRELIHFRIRS